MSEGKPTVTQELWIEEKSRHLFQNLMRPTHLFLDGLVTRDLDVLIVDRACQMLVDFYGGKQR